MNTESLSKYLKLLQERSTPSFNDRAYHQYVEYINAFLRYFGKERVYLVGSTAENLKVRWSKDSGDADFLLLSGRLEVPVEDIVFREDMPCFIWVKVDKSRINRNITLIDDKYLPSDVLRSVGPELFTILRGIYLLFTSNTSYRPSNKHLTKHGITSKVGLAVSEYRNMEIEGKSLASPMPMCLSKRRVLARNETFRTYIEKRKRGSVFYKQDVEFIDRVVQFISSIKIPGSVGVGFGYFEHFAYICSLIVESFKESTHQENVEEDVKTLEAPEDAESDVEINPVIFENDFESLSDDLSENGHFDGKNIDREQPPRKIRAAYSERTCKDFVPAVKISGSLKYIDVWRIEEHRWLSQGEIDAISKMDVFFVARYAPVNPSRKDFCLSFTLAENKLSECLSPVQRNIVLIMKAFLKGIFTQIHKERGREMKLTTFHAKTVIYRVSDVTDPSLWSEVNVFASLIRVLEYLKEALARKELLHYFIPSNLFAGFENEDFEVLLKCTETVIANPISGFKAFFELDDGVPHELWLTEEEAAYLEHLSTDGGVSEEVDRVEEFIVELLRGLKESHRDARGNAPFIEACSAVLNLFLRDEAKINFREDAGSRTQGSCQLYTIFGPLLAEALSGGVPSIPTENSVLKIIGQILEGFKTEEENRAAFQHLKYILLAYFSR